MFTTFVVQPLFNLLSLIYAILPSHNYGLSLILFTILIRIALWPVLKKQLHHAKAMRDLQPEIKKIKKQAKGDRTKESQLLMELYKERGINPFSTFPILILQFIILIGLYSGLQKVIKDPHALINFSYPSVQNLPWMQELAQNIHRFDNTLLGFVDLSKPALGAAGLYMPALLLVAGSAVAQYFQSKQLLPNDKDQRSLREILKAAGNGQQADQSEVNAAVGRSTVYILPFMIFFLGLSFPAALSLYWFVSAAVAYLQQSRILGQDEAEMEAIADAMPPKKKDTKNIPEAQVVRPTKKPKKGNKKGRKRA